MKASIKKYYCIFCVLTLPFFLIGQMNEKDSITVLSINFFTRTMVAVQCEEFATTFNKQVRINKVFSQDSISMFDKMIKKVKVLKSNKEFSFDTKAKLFFKDKFGNDFLICVNSFNFLVNGKRVKRNRLLFDFILSMIPNEQKISHPGSM